MYYLSATRILGAPGILSRIATQFDLEFGIDQGMMMIRNGWMTERTM